MSLVTASCLRTAPRARRPAARTEAAASSILWRSSSRPPGSSPRRSARSTYLVHLTLLRYYSITYLLTHHFLCRFMTRRASSRTAAGAAPPWCTEAPTSATRCGSWTAAAICWSPPRAGWWTSWIEVNNCYMLNRCRSASQFHVYLPWGGGVNARFLA